MADENTEEMLDDDELADAWGSALAEQGVVDENQDIAAAWGAALEEQGGDSADMATQWAALADENEEELEVSGRAADRILNQEEIDNLLGFSIEDIASEDKVGIRELINSGNVSYERLPMLEIVFDRLVRLTTTSLRNFTSDNVEVSIDNVTSVRFGDYLNSIELPSILGLFKAKEWDGFGLCTVESGLVYSMIEVLLGGGRGGSGIRVLGRPFTTIETGLIRQMIEIILQDLAAAFAPLSPVHFQLDRLETNPRFAAISRPANAATLVELRIDLDDRGGVVQIMIPYATLEPIRGLLLQMVMGEKFGRDATWENHLAGEIHAAELKLDAILYETQLPLGRAMNLSIGDTLMFESSPSDPIYLKCGEVALTDCMLGKVNDNIAVRVNRNLRPPKMTMEAFENAIQKELEPQK